MCVSALTCRRRRPSRGRLYRAPRGSAGTCPPHTSPPRTAWDTHTPHGPCWTACRLWSSHSSGDRYLSRKSTGRSQVNRSTTQNTDFFYYLFNIFFVTIFRESSLKIAKFIKCSQNVVFHMKCKPYFCPSPSHNALKQNYKKNLITTDRQNMLFHREERGKGLAISQTEMACIRNGWYFIQSTNHIFLQLPYNTHCYSLLLKK